MAILATITKYLDIAGPLLGLLLCLYWQKGKRKAGGFPFVLGYLILQLVANVTAKYLGIFQQVNNIKIYQANAFFSLSIIGLYFWDVFKQSLSHKRSSRYKFLALTAAAISLLLIGHEDTDTLNSLSLSFTALIICFYCVLYFINLLLNTAEDDLLRSTSFWQACSLFLYYAGSFFIYATFRFFATEDPYGKFMILWSIHNALLFLSCIILGVSCKYSSVNHSND
jgi:hypothetical protein